MLFRSADDGLARADDILLIVESGAGMLFGEHVEVGLSHGLARVLHVPAPGQRAAAFDDARLAVFEINVVGNCVEEGVEEITLLSKGLLGLHAVGDVPEYALGAGDLALGAAHGDLEHLDVGLLVVGLEVFLGRAERETRIDDLLVVATVLLRQRPGGEVEVRLADNLLRVSDLTPSSATAPLPITGYLYPNGV